MTDATARIVMMVVMATDTAENMEMKRLIGFASDVAELADQRLDLELRELVDQLHADLGGGEDDDG